MTTTTSFVRGRLRVTHPETYRATSVRTRPRSPDRITSVDVDEMMRATLRQSGFTALQQVRVAPARGADRPPEPPRPTPVTLTLDLAGTEDAVVLTESAGVYRWLRPRPGGTRDAVRSAVFDLTVPDRPPGMRGLGRRPPDELRATVLSYAVPDLARAAIRVLEGIVHPELVRIIGDDVGRWQRLDRLDQLGLDPSRTSRLLLFVHGTFDSTAGAFGGLTVTPEGRAFLLGALEAYDAVVGFDHRTLSEDPLANARDLAARLASFPAQQPVSIDVVCHSRGGITARSLVESVLPGLPWRGSVDRAVFVAATNAGTHFADAARWADLVDVQTNLVAANARALADRLGGGSAAAAAVDALRAIGALVKWLASFATDPDSVPGIAAMVPDGPFVTALNADQPGQPRPGTPWFVVSSDFVATLADHPPELPDAVVVEIVDGIVDRVIQGPNDLVVDVASMGAIDLPHGGGYVRGQYAYPPNSTVYHTNYMMQPEVCRALDAWLLQRVDDPGGGPVSLGPTSGPGPAPGERRTERRRSTSRGRDVGAEAEPPEADDAEPPETAESSPRAADDSEHGAAATAATVRATVGAEMPQHPPVALPVSVRVRVSRAALEATVDTVSASTVLAVRPDDPLDVQVIPATNVTLDGTDLDRLLLPLGGGWAELSFTVRPVAPGPVRVTVLVRQGRDLLGRLSLEATAVDPADVSGGQQALTRAQVDVASATSPALADVAWLEIAQLEREGQTRFQYELRLPGVPQRITGTSAPIQDAEAFVSNLFREVQQLWFDRSDQPDAYLAALQDFGAHLFETLFPQELQALLWDHRADLDNLLLLADEPFIPWELVHLKPPRGPRQRAPRFLGQRGLVRWPFTPFPAQPSLRARAGRVFAVCPDYADHTLDLSEVQAEAQFLTTTLGATPVAGTTDGVRRLLRRRGGFDLLHFSGHGTADPGNIAEAKILLAGREVGGALVSDYLSSTTVAENVRLAGRDGGGPLVVLNACQVGRQGEDLTSLGGFARAFLEAGASAFVSCLWSVNQKPARIFVETFYARLLRGDTVASAALAGRTAARAEGDGTWLAYVVYARPDAVLVRA